MLSFLFVPASNPKMIAKAADLPCYSKVLDFEDAISVSEWEAAFSNARDLEEKSSFYVRPSMGDCTVAPDLAMLKALATMGFSKFFLPKLRTESDVLEVSQLSKGLAGRMEFCLLVENSSLLLNLHEILRKGLLNITGICFGSHDYCSEMCIVNNERNTWFAKSVIVNVARAHGLLCIDSPSMNLSDEAAFHAECKGAFEQGFDGKVVLHPWQLNIMKAVKYYSDDEVEEARHVLRAFSNDDFSSAAVLKINGKIYEKPHLKRFSRIIQWAG